MDTSLRSISYLIKCSLLKSRKWQLMTVNFFYIIYLITRCSQVNAVNATWIAVKRRSRMSTEQQNFSAIYSDTVCLPTIRRMCWNIFWNNLSSPFFCICFCFQADLSWGVSTVKLFFLLLRSKFSVFTQISYRILWLPIANSTHRLRMPSLSSP